MEEPSNTASLSWLVYLEHQWKKYMLTSTRINEADQTYSHVVKYVTISKTNNDNLVRFSLFSFSKQKAFVFMIIIKHPPHMTP